MVMAPPRAAFVALLGSAMEIDEDAFPTIIVSCRNPVLDSESVAITSRV
jgi:hypothetical protein